MPKLTQPLMAREGAALRWRIDLGCYIRDRRETKGMTQAELAEAVDLDNKQSISSIETGRTGVPSERIALYADALGVERQEFAKNVLRWSDPWIYACLFGMDAQLSEEISLAPERVNRRRGPRMRTPRDAPLH
jgi:transcriptional regulator with XRE-family HTH domain